MYKIYEHTPYGSGNVKKQMDVEKKSTLLANNSK